MWTHYLLAFAAGLAGMALFFVLWHAWADHRFVDDIRNQLLQQQQQQQQRAAPPK